MRASSASAVAVAVLAAAAVLAGGCADRPAPGTATVVVTAPFATRRSLSEQQLHGAELAAAQLGSIDLGGGRRLRLGVRRVDTGGSPTAAAAAVRAAAAEGAIAVLDEGDGVEGGWRGAAAAGVPVIVTNQGGAELVDEAARPNVFRVAPTDRGVSFRLAEYVVPKGQRIGVLTDDSGYGTRGRRALDKALARNPEAVAGRAVVPAASTDPAPQVLALRQDGAEALVVWAEPVVVAQTVRAARGGGFTGPIYTATSGEDPLVRQQLADRPDWIEGTVIAQSRLTSEKGPGPFARFREAYEQRFGVERAGFGSGGRQVVQPPGAAMYAYDAVLVLGAAIERCRCQGPSPALVRAMEEVSATGANGDLRGFNARSHEGVVDDDVAFVAVRSMVLVPVTDDPLSATLPAVPQLA